MELIIIRHGRPEKIESSTEFADPDLTSVGHRQAVAVADWLSDNKIDAIYSSPMARARQTAEPLAQQLGLPVVVEDRIAEFDKEEHSYIPVEELKADKEAYREFIAEMMAGDMAAFSEEVIAGLTDIVNANRGKRVAVFCHGGVINMWAAHALGLEPKMFFDPDYTSINRFKASSSGINSVASLNDVGHFKANPELQLG